MRRIAAVRLDYLLPVLLLSAACGAPASGDRLEHGRRLAARFLHVPDDAPGLARGETVDVNGGPFVLHKATWEYQGPDPATTERTDCDVLVDVDLGYVAYADCEQEGARSEAPARRRGGVLRRGECLARARAYLAAQCWFWHPNDGMYYEWFDDDEADPVYQFDWEGDGPGEFRHDISVSVSALTGKIVSYLADVLPADPRMTVPIRVSESEALAAVRAQLRKLLPELVGKPKLTAGPASTCSLFAPPGRPVYMFRLEGERTDPVTRTRIPLNVLLGVDAHSGEVLTKLVEWPSKPGPKADVRINPTQALARARQAAPPELKSARFEVGALTPCSRLAPLGTLVYPVRVTGEWPAPGKPGELWDWGGTWGVDALTGHVYGLIPGDLVGPFQATAQRD